LCNINGIILSIWRIDYIADAGGIITNWVNMLPWMTSSVIKKGTAANTLRAMANNGILYYYINGGLVWVGLQTGLV
jgi:hypothetical protein